MGIETSVQGQGYLKTCHQPKVPSDAEIEALNALRKIKEEVRALKRRISQISTSPEREKNLALKELENEMVRLKEQWREWDKKREVATRERMILLGHEEAS